MPETSKVPKARRYLLTLNEPERYQMLKERLTGLKSFRYLLSAKEKAPTTGHEHIHIYVVFNNSISLKNVEGAHIDICRGSHKAVKNYVEKDGDIIDSIGEEPHQGRSHTVEELSEIKTFQEAKELPAYLLKAWQNVQSMDLSMTKKDVYKPEKEIVYIWGDSNTGKTKHVYDLLNDEDRFDRVKHENGFWIGVSQSHDVKIAWYDDFRDNHMKPSEFINFIDYYSNPMNIKGGYVLNHYDKIFITSVQDPEEIYAGMKDQEPRRQWLRRMKIIHMTSLS